MTLSKKVIFAFSILLTFAAVSVADAATPRPTMVVSTSATVKGGEVLLGDIARFSANSEEQKKLIEKLRAISITNSPIPKGQVSIPGVRIVEAIQDADISLDEIGYSIPQSVTVTRAGRVIDANELLEPVRKALSLEQSLDLQVREITLAHAHVVPEGSSSYQIERLGAPSVGKVPLRVAVMVDGKTAARFLATAVVDDWREVPVVNRKIERGMLIEPGDVEIIRLNLFKQPNDVAENITQVVGRRAKTQIDAGSTVRKSLIDIPPVIPDGKKVSIIYRRGGLTATASGTALDDGFEQSVIRVRNDNSRKVIRATVISDSQVEVE